MKTSTLSQRILKTAAVTAALAGVAAAPAAAVAAEISGIHFADQVSVGAKTLKLNGMGLRQATIFKVNVYASALYVETPSHDGAKIAASDELKHLEMVFMRDVDAGKISGAWEEGFEKNCAENCEAAKPGIARLQALTTDMKKSDMMAFNFYPDKVEVSVRNGKPVAIEGKPFAKALIQLWIGRNPPNAGLKSGLLGIKD